MVWEWGKEWHYQNFILEKSFWLAIWYSNLTPGHIFGQNYGLKEDEMVKEHHQLNGHEFDQTPGAKKNSEAQHTAVHGFPKSET